MRHSAQLTHDPLDARQFELAVRRLADALSYGQESSPFLGAGIEYVQSRLYQPGDPVKFIDWRVTGRTGRFHVKEYEAPRQMPVYLLVDTSASMCITSQHLSKYAWAVQLAGGLALAALDHMNPVGLLGVGERELHQTPTLARNAVMQWMHQLRHYRFVEGTTLGRRVRELIPRIEQRCLFIVLSDLHDPDAIPAIRLMAQDHDCMVLHLEDPAERGQTGGGIFRAVEAETGRAFVAHGRSRWFAEDATHALSRDGVDYLPLQTDRPILPRLRHFMKSRGGTRRMG
ncbi:MAG TPA: DUF58 domain-containing protein [Verrucomicrobiae bacterium]|nr:DUF58 domain-containing protein [Verrucomicrobiae bacterium]